MKPSQQKIEIDWQQARRRLDKAIAATDAAISPAQAREVMDFRAAALARVPLAPVDVAGTFEVLTFQIGQENYAIHTHLVREVLREPGITPVPGTPDFVLGIANLRGEMLAVLDLAAFLAAGGPRQESLPWLIILGADRAEFGIVCDAVSEVITLRTDALHLPPNSLAAEFREFIAGVTRDALIVLDGEVLLNDERLFIDDTQPG